MCLISMAHYIQHVTFITYLLIWGAQKQTSFLNGNCQKSWNHIIMFVLSEAFCLCLIKEVAGHQAITSGSLSLKSATWTMAYLTTCNILHV